VREEEGEETRRDKEERRRGNKVREEE